MWLDRRLYVIPDDSNVVRADFYRVLLSSITTADKYQKTTLQYTDITVYTKQTNYRFQN